MRRTRRRRDGRRRRCRRDLPPGGRVAHRAAQDELAGRVDQQPEDGGVQGLVVHALNASSARVSFAEIETDRGHDAFLLDVPEFFDIARAFLGSCWQEGAGSW